MKVVLNVIVFLNICKIVWVQELGDACVIESNGSQGRGLCKLLQDCPTALQAIKMRQPPKNCGFQGSQPIVCCLPDPTRIPGEISRQKCKEYSKFVNQIVAVALVVSEEPDELDQCGFKVVNLVAGGGKAKRKEFPHTALIGFQVIETEEIQWLCGGSLISEQYVMTVGHCIRDRDNDFSKFVKVGMSSIHDKSTFVRQYKIIEHVKHPDYKPPNKYNDIALFKLEQPVVMTPYSRPACLFTNNVIQPDKVLVTGLAKNFLTGVRHQDIFKVTVDVVSQEKCNSSYGIMRLLRDGIRGDILLCTDPENLENSSCLGSGGPLQMYHTEDNIKCMYDIAGITSFGKGCGVGASPTVYTRVSAYIKWIEDVVWI